MWEFAVRYINYTPFVFSFPFIFNCCLYNFVKKNMNFFTFQNKLSLEGKLWFFATVRFGNSEIGNSENNTQLNTCFKPLTPLLWRLMISLGNSMICSDILVEMRAMSQNYSTRCHAWFSKKLLLSANLVTEISWRPVAYVYILCFLR